MCRLLYRLLVSLAGFAVRSGRSKDLEIIVLRHQLTVLHRQNNRPAIADEDRALLAAVAAALPRLQRGGWLVTPETLLRWHRRRIARYWTQPSRTPGRPCTAVDLRRLIIEMAVSNPTWGYRRITGELVGLGHRVGASTVWRILKQRGIGPAPQRTSVTWTQFLRSQAAVACDFATADTALLRRYYLLFFIDITTREVLYGAITTNPTGVWTTQPARNLCLRYPPRLTTLEHFCETAPASSPAISTRSSEAKVSRSCAPRLASQWPTRSRNGGSPTCAERSLIAPSSGTGASLSGS